MRRFGETLTVSCKITDRYPKLTSENSLGSRNIIRVCMGILAIVV